MEQLLTDQQIEETIDNRYKNSFPDGLAQSHEEAQFATPYLMGFADGAKWARQQIMEKLSGMKVYMLYDYPDSVQDFYGVFFSKEDAQNAIFDNSLWEGDNKDYTDCGYAIEEIPLNPKTINE